MSKATVGREGLSLPVIDIGLWGLTVVNRFSGILRLFKAPGYGEIGISCASDRRCMHLIYLKIEER